jgi:hypothetical protein
MGAVLLTLAMLPDSDWGPTRRSYRHDLVCSIMAMRRANRNDLAALKARLETVG